MNEQGQHMHQTTAALTHAEHPAGADIHPDGARGIEPLGRFLDSDKP